MPEQHYIPFTSEEEFEAYKATRGDLFIGGKLCVCRRAGVWCSDDGTVNTTGVAPLWMYKRSVPIVTHDGKRYWQGAAFGSEAEARQHLGVGPIVQVDSCRDDRIGRVLEGLGHWEPTLFAPLHPIEEEKPEQQRQAFDPSLYEAFGSRAAASKHHGKVVYVGYNSHEHGRVFGNGKPWHVAWGMYAPFVEPKPFKDARVMYRWMGKEGAKIVAVSHGQVRLLVDGLWEVVDEGNGTTDIGHRMHAPRTPQNWRPYCPVWDAQKPTAEEVRAEAVDAFAGELLDLAERYGVTHKPQGGTPFGPELTMRFNLTNCHKPEDK